MEERKGTYNEDGEYVMTDEEAMAEYKVLQPLMKKFNNDEIDAIFYVDEINEHLKKLMPYYKQNGIEAELIEFPPDIRRKMKTEASIEMYRRTEEEKLSKMTKEERVEYGMQIARHATEFAKKMGMKIYDLKDKDE